MHASARQTYDDAIEDVVSAPDICMFNLVTNDNRMVIVALHIHDRVELMPGDSYRVHFDTDASEATGAPAEAGPLAGADFMVDVSGASPTLNRWDGATFAAVVPQPSMTRRWSEEYGGPMLTIPRNALGGPSRIRFVFSTANAEDRDLAPDRGAWSYAVTPFALTATNLRLGAAHAGRRFTASMMVMRSDFETALDRGAIACRASAGRSKLSGRGRFDRGRAACSWTIPRTARGKLVRGSISARFDGATASRSFAVRVR
jgi:hypothetical protein